MNKNLLTLSNEKLIENMSHFAKSERKITFIVLQYIAEIEKRRLFAELGYSSMFEFLTKQHCYSESAAYRRIQASRLLNKLPEVAKKIENGNLNLTQLAKAQTHIKQKEQQFGKAFGSKSVDLAGEARAVLSKLENKSTRQTEQILAEEFGELAKVHEVEKSLKDNGLRLELVFSEQQKIIIEKVRFMMSHQNPSHSWTELIVLLAEKEIRRKMGPSAVKDTSAEPLLTPYVKQTVPKKVKSLEASKFQKFCRRASSLRKDIPVNIKRTLFLKANHCCEYFDPKTNKKCESRSFLEVDHIKPVKHGGDNDISNLRVLCRQHNLLMAEVMGLSLNKVGLGQR